jgi:membrane-bound lytic murein transglycosylase MltF
MPKSSGWSRVVVLFCFMFALTAPCLVVVSGTAAAMVAAQEDDPATLPEDRIQDLILPAEKAFSGDVKEIRQRGVLRVLVTYRKGDFFIADGELRGVEVELARAFAAWLGKKGGKKALPVRAIFIPVAFDELLTALEQGKGDIAAAGFTVTEARRARVPFATPYLRGIDEVFAIRKGAPVPTSLDELAGRTVHVVRGSSHEQHLGELNVRLAAQGLAPLNIVTPSADLQPEDLFDLLGTGAIDLMVADSHRARLWRRAMPDVQVVPSLQLKTGQDIAWAVRPDAPGLLHEVNAFFAADGGRAVKKAAGLLERYYADRSWHVEGLNRKFAARAKRLYPHFIRYGDTYAFDPLLLLAQGYRESRLNQKLRSPRGAVGVMQVLPSTARTMGFPDVVKEAVTNIHAGVRYLEYVRSDYFSDADIREPDRTLFSLAAYNMGPNRMARVRERAIRMGLDPNRWFGNVEYAALRYVGREPVTYVAQISSYYIAYQGSHAVTGARRPVLEALQK